MKLSLATFGLLALVASSYAQYFSQGWVPGQKQPEPQLQEKPAIRTVLESKPTPVVEPVKTKPTTPFSLLNMFDINKILNTGPSVALFNRFGINITERIEASLAQIWDERVPLITDDNYEDVVVNEILTEQEEKDRLWVIVISATTANTDSVSKLFDNVFDSVFNESLIAGDLPHVKWGRIDYLNVTRVTTKWSVWHAPYLVILKDRGKTLRFYRPRNLRLQEDAFREFLKTDGWQVTPPWSSAYAPGGPNEYILDFYAVWLTKFYNLVMLVPRWMLVFGSGTVASLLIGFLHKSTNPAVAAQPQSTSTGSTTTATPRSTDTPAQSNPESTASQAKRTGVKQRKPQT